MEDHSLQRSNMAAFKPENVEDFYEMGEWHFGQVRQVRERSTGTLWAGKFMKIKKSPCSLLGLDRGGVERESERRRAVRLHRWEGESSRK
uniref:Protein kinase domain-containing protein n=1 Tax=Labrus bergylta TaxID=56723 RepID=A0A3Q3FD32_9LABR